MYNDARRSMMTRYYSKMWEALNQEDMKEAEHAAKVLLKMGATAKGLKASAERRGKSPEETREAFRTMRRASS